MNWINGVLIAIDQLGNAIAGGNPDATISARTGYFARVAETPFRSYWQFMERVINFTFLPVDGPDHCYQAYLSDKDEKNEEGSDLMRGLLGILIILTCLPLSIITRLYVLAFPCARYEEQDKK